MSGPRPEWTQADAEMLRSFLTTGAGQKLARIIEWDAARQNRGAVGVVNGNHAYLSGFAAGFEARGASLLQLSADVRPRQDEHTGDGDGADRPGERFAP